MRKILLFLLIGIFALVPYNAFAQTNNSNHSPVITSNPSNETVAGKIYSYQIIAEDEDNDSLIYSLVNYPENMIIDENTGIISWTPTKTGLFNVVVQVSDQEEGYDVQAFQISVKPCNIYEIIISPNDRPNIISLGATKQFVVLALDKYQNKITDPSITWSTDENIGEINQNGIFIAKRGGVGFVAAECQEIKASVGVIVKGVITSEATETASPPEPVEEAETTETPTPIVLGEAVQEEETTIDETTEELVATEEETSEEQPAETEEETTCSNWPNWVIIIVLIIYSIILIAYYQYLKKYKTIWWWVPPIVLTLIGLLLYYNYFCTGTYIWWPWTLLGLGVIITVFYPKKPSHEKEGSEQNQLPF